MIVGDMDSVTDDVLRCGAEVVVHAYPDGRAPGLARVQELGVDGDHVPGRGDQRGHRDAAGRREGRHAHRRGRHPRHPGGVPGQGPRRHGLDLPHPAADRRQAGRRQGREPALPQPDLRGALSCWCSPRSSPSAPRSPCPRPARAYLDLLADQWDSFVFWFENLFS